MKSNIMRLKNKLQKEKNSSISKNLRIQELESKLVSKGSNSLASDYLTVIIESKYVEIMSLKEK